jgi:hypothetical protein
MNTMSAPRRTSSISAAMILGGLTTHLGIRTRAQASGDLTADIELHIGVAHQERLGIGVDGDELDALQAGVDHAVHRVAAGAADADHLDDRKVVLRVVCHGSSFLLG